jgi:hypothetical protein
MAEVEKLISEYRQLLVDRAEMRQTPKLANRLYMQNRKIYRILRESPDGRRAISALMKDPLIFVRLTAATQSLQWEHDEAEQTLEAIELASDAGLYAVSAKYVLMGWRDGTLDLE